MTQARRGSTAGGPRSLHAGNEHVAALQGRPDDLCSICRTSRRRTVLADQSALAAAESCRPFDNFQTSAVEKLQGAVRGCAKRRTFDPLSLSAIPLDQSANRPLTVTVA